MQIINTKSDVGILWEIKKARKCSNDTVNPIYKYSQVHNIKTICLVQKTCPFGFDMTL